MLGVRKMGSEIWKGNLFVAAKSQLKRGHQVNAYTLNRRIRQRLTYLHANKTQMFQLSFANRQCTTYNLVHHRTKYA